jgi:glutamate/tyrosine decarboxylase-like PLP-dependent enzyme
MKNIRHTPVSMSKEEFRKLGFRLVETLAGFFDTIEKRPVTTGENSREIQAVLGTAPLPIEGKSAVEILTQATELLLEHSLFNGHPKFSGYVTSSPAQIGALADLLAASINPNVGANILSPMATEIEKQTIQWLSEFIGLTKGYGGVLVSGGNVANFTGFLAGRTAKSPKNIKEEGIGGSTQPLVVYCSKTTHTWIEKASVIFGLGSNSVRYIDTYWNNKMNTGLLEATILHDLEIGYKPIMVIGTAGDVSTGAVDNLQEISAICKKFNLWFHVDGAYGMPAAVLPELNDLFRGIEEADSIALDPHKWLYAPLEAGCTLVKNPDHLLETFSSHPVYYNFNTEDAPAFNFYEYGLQNSRGFRALKVWMALQQAGKKGYMQMIGDDIRLSEYLFQLADRHVELQAITQSLSITTFRYIPSGVNNDDNETLNPLNEAILNRLQKEGRVFLSNAVVNGKYCLRSCIVNFRTTEKDIEEIIDIVIETGKIVYKERLQQEIHQLQ